MAAGKPITRKSGSVMPNKPANGTAGAAVTLTGSTMRAGAPCAFAWGVNQWDPPATGWTTATTSDAFGNVSLVSTYPTAGAKWLWMRRVNYPRVCAPIGPVTVA